LSKSQYWTARRFFMAQPKFTLYKYIKLQAGWRHRKAAFHDNGKIKPNIVIVGKDKHEEKHPEGSYYLANVGQWIPLGDNALEAERRRRERVSLAEYQRLSGTAPVQSSGRATASGKTPLLAAAPKYFLNLEARGLDAKTIRTYRTGVDPFVENCARTYVEDVTKQDMINFMGWLRASFTRRLLLTQKEPAKSGLRARPYNASSQGRRRSCPRSQMSGLEVSCERNLRIFANC